MADFSIFPLGDQAITISFGNSISVNIHRKIVALKKLIESSKTDWIRDIVLAYSSLTVVYDAFRVAQQKEATSANKFVRDFLLNAAESVDENFSVASSLIEIPVCYDDEFGIDLVRVASENEISVGEVIELHHSVTYKVYMIGFLPGFAYMASVPHAIATPRLATPRSSVPAGSVGIAGIQTGIYPVNSPGGWNIIGRTPDRMFDKHAFVPSKLEPGDEVKFYSISKAEFQKLSR